MRSMALIALVLTTAACREAGDVYYVTEEGDVYNYYESEETDTGFTADQPECSGFTEYINGEPETLASFPVMDLRHAFITVPVDQSSTVNLNLSSLGGCGDGWTLKSFTVSTWNSDYESAPGDVMHTLVLPVDVTMPLTGNSPGCFEGGGECWTNHVATDVNLNVPPTGVITLSVKHDFGDSFSAGDHLFALYSISWQDNATGYQTYWPVDEMVEFVFVE